jgi:hypothetical protein
MGIGNESKVHQGGEYDENRDGDGKLH